MVLAFVSSMLVILAAAVFATVRYWAWLDGVHLAGIAIIAEVFFAMYILGAGLQMSEDLSAGESRLSVAKAIGRQSLLCALALGAGLTVLALMVVVAWEYLTPLIGPELAWFAFLLSFIGLIRLVMIIADRFLNQGSGLSNEKNSG